MLKLVLENTKQVSTVYSTWCGKSNLLVVAIRGCHVHVPCHIIGETTDELRVCVQQGWEMNVQKELILAIEEDAVDTSVN